MQLQWATLQANPGQRESIKVARATERNNRIIELVAWFDDHVTR